MRIIWWTLVALQGCDAKNGSDGGTSAPEARWEGQYAGECSDEADNDRDGLFDCDDSDCEGAPNCTDDAVGLDADSDGGDELDADSDGGAALDGDDGADGGGEIDENEGDAAGECGDNIDNDRDGMLDCVDPGCIGSSECSDGDTGVVVDADDSSTLDEGGSACEDEEGTPTEAGVGEMLIKGWITLSGDVSSTELSSASCKITTWPWSGIRDGVPDFMSGVGMLGEACIDCPSGPDTPIPFAVVLPVDVDGAEVGVIAKVDVDERIYEKGTDANPLLSVSAGDADDFVFDVEIAEPGPDDPGVDGGGGDLDPLDSGPDEPPTDTTGGGS